MYLKLKRAAYNLIRDDDENNFAAALFDGSIIFLIIVNVLLVILDTFKGFSETVLSVFRYIEIVSVVIFTIEYLLRVWTASYIRPKMSSIKARLRYMVSFRAIIDLAAILPFYLPLLLPIDLGVLRMIRLLRLLRILKVNRYTHALAAVGDVMKRKSAQLVSSMLVVAVLMVMASVLMYNIENDAQPNVFQNAFSGLWWAIATLTTVGYGDIYPVTIMGKVLSAVIELLGIGLVAVPTGIISAGFIEDITNSDKKPTEITETHKEEHKHYCPYCGEKLD